MDINIDNIYTLVTTAGFVLYVASHLLAVFGYPKKAEKLNKIRKAIDGIGANYRNTRNL